MKTYDYYKTHLTGTPYPYAVLDEEYLYRNADKLIVKAKNKQIRIASKSIRCHAVMRMLLDYRDTLQGIMTYHGREALYLAEQGFDNLLMGYPVVEANLLKAIAEVIKSGKEIILMIDSVDHINILDAIGNQVGVKMPICIDLDLSDDYPGLHFGVWRSSLTSSDKLDQLLKHIKIKCNIELVGLMGYEAQVAGVVDDVKNGGIKNSVVRLLKRRSIPRIADKRKQAVEMIQDYGFKLTYVNGGGTGSIDSTILEDVVTEVTVGSGFYCSHLFDNYTSLDLEPALFYGINIVRQPNNKTYTCHGGGFIASGAIESIKAPVVHLPKGGKLDKMEGAGEVQTPIRFSNGTKLNLNDPIYLRHAKAGELNERFDTIQIINSNGNLRTVNTYRGDGMCFG